MNAMKKQDVAFELQPAIKYFLVIFLPSFLLLSVILFLLCRSENLAERTVLENAEVHRVRLKAETLTTELRLIALDLMILATQQELVAMFESEDRRYQSHMEAELLSYSKHKKYYDQIRFLDASGMEIIRVNQNQGEPYVVPAEQLQQQDTRYYFRDIFSLGKGEIFVSPLDLNIEGGQVEQPLKPMMRYGTPVFDKLGQKRGIVLINYLCQPMLDRLSSGDGLGKIMLLNSDGFWLKGIQPENEWGFMFDHRKGRKFENTFPEAWQKICSGASGQYDNAEGLFTVATANPLIEGQVTSEGTGSKVFAPTASRLDAKAYYWKVVSYVSPEALGKASQHLIHQYFLIYSGLSILLMIVTGPLAYAMGKHRRAEAALRDSEEKFKQILNSVRDAILMMDPDGRVAYWNPAGETIFGYTSQEAQGKDLHVLIALPRYQESFRNGFSHFLETGQGAVIDKTQELIAIKKDGTEFPIELSVVGFTLKNKWHAAGIIRDISERKEMQASLQEVERAKVSMQTAGAAAHEINQPLSVVLGLSQILLRMGLPDDATREDIESIYAAGLKIKEIVQQMATIQKYAITTYVDTTEIIDLNSASQTSESP
ncbi:MAG: PAS domain S-box protein [Candidatus Latescibacteria bacterium]|nr:PAS domain S-box protein [Candidatus Latescibacterota bacterium]